jgi:hypothetical protein
MVDKPTTAQRGNATSLEMPTSAAHAAHRFQSDSETAREQAAQHQFDLRPAPCRKQESGQELHRTIDDLLR